LCQQQSLIQNKKGEEKEIKIRLGCMTKYYKFHNIVGLKSLVCQQNP
jgi:hypothetical protein